MKNLILILVAFFTISINPLFSQEEGKDEPKKVVITTNDGVQRIGVILSDDGREVLLETEAMGKIYIYKSDIKSIKDADEVEFEIINGDFRSSGPFTTRYAFTTNALPIKKGENYAKLGLGGPEVHFALSDRFNIGVMTTWIAAPIAIAAKYTIPTKDPNLNFGLGTILGTTGWVNQFRNFGGLHWGMVTIGDRMKNVTLSAGVSYANLNNSQTYPKIGTHPATTDQWGYTYFDIPYEEVQSSLFVAPTFSIAGIASVGQKASFVFDSMILFGNQKSIQRQVEYVNDPITGVALHAIVTESPSSGSRGSVIAIMPGMRFQKTDSRAFQFNLVGGTFIQNGNSQSLAFPMFSWFFKF